MAVTRSTAADRRRLGFPVLGARDAMAGMPGPPVRQLEAGLLAAAAAVALLALSLVYLAVTKQLAGIDEQLAKGEIVNLNALRGSEQLLPLLDFYEESAERAFAAEEIWKRAHLRPFPNVGERARLRGPAARIRPL